MSLKLTTVCDRCKVEAVARADLRDTTRFGVYGYTIEAPTSWTTLPGQVYLCYDCAEAHKQWLKGGSAAAEGTVTP